MVELGSKFQSLNTTQAQRAVNAVFSAFEKDMNLLKGVTETKKPQTT
ncbi:hypothetical protein HZC07_05140 [Candidatus Micrarchaeota archaeon]|nr:hypothetical protein [Candidatus Micrarchaeota archaeon]